MTVMLAAQRRGSVKGGKTVADAFAAVEAALAGGGQEPTEDQVDMVEAILLGSKNGRAVWADTLKRVASGDVSNFTPVELAAVKR